MRFALFYEIPVARPWGPDSERLAYQHTHRAGGRRRSDAGWDAFWTVEHHFLEEYSHCSNPEVLYGAIAALTERMRLGYGVRLMPKPYNHPVRTAEAAAVLDLISNGRVDLGTGRSSTRAELEGFGIDPSQTRGMWQEAIGHVVGCWTNDEYEFEGEHWSMPRRRVLPKPIQSPHPPIWGATSSEDGHRQVGELGLGPLLVRGGRAAGVGQGEDRHLPQGGRRAARRRSAPTCTTRRRPSRWRICAPTIEEARATARESFEWYPKPGARLIASVAEMQADRGEELGTYAYAADLKRVADDGSLDFMNLDYLETSGACVLGTPDQCIETCKRYEDAGVDQLLCLVNPYKIPHESVMQTIRMLGEHVIPEFRQ